MMIHISDNEICEMLRTIWNDANANDSRYSWHCIRTAIRQMINMAVKSNDYDTCDSLNTLYWLADYRRIMQRS